MRLASRGVELSPTDRDIWRILGVAQYRAGNWRGATEAIQKSVELATSTSFDLFPLAMARWHLGNKDHARVLFEEAVAWMEENQPKDEQLVRYRAEAAELLGLADSAKSSADLVAPQKP